MFIRKTNMIRIGIIGVGGFAASHHQAVQSLEATGECRLVCTCDPGAAALAGAGVRHDFVGRGVRTYPTTAKCSPRISTNWTL
jgi:predicted dehydrogenase